MVEWNSHPFIFDFYFLKISLLLICPLAGVGAENQTEEGSRKGKRDGGKTGGISF